MNNKIGWFNQSVLREYPSYTLTMESNNSTPPLSPALSPPLWPCVMTGVIRWHSFERVTRDPISRPVPRNPIATPTFRWRNIPRMGARVYHPLLGWILGEGAWGKMQGGGYSWFQRVARESAGWGCRQLYVLDSSLAIGKNMNSALIISICR